MDIENYESVVMYRGSDAEEILAIMEDKGEAEALAHLRKLHEPGEGTLIMKPGKPWKETDSIYEESNYIMYYDAQAPYVGLVYYTNNIE